VKVNEKILLPDLFFRWVETRRNWINWLS